MKPVAEIRRERLKQLLQEDFEGNGQKLADAAHKDRRQISAWLRYKGMRDQTAREIEAAAMKPSGWLDNEDNGQLTTEDQPRPSSHSQRTDRQKMRDAQKVLREIGVIRGNPELPSDPDALAVAYDFLVDFDTPLSEANMLDMIKAVAPLIRGVLDGSEGSSST